MRFYARLPILLLAEQLEGAFLCLIARLDQVLQRFLAEGMLFLGDDAPLVLHQILAREPTRCVVSRVVPYLSFRSNGGLFSCFTRRAFTTTHFSHSIKFGHCGGHSILE